MQDLGLLVGERNPSATQRKYGLLREAAARRKARPRRKVFCLQGQRYPVHLHRKVVKNRKRVKPSHPSLILWP